MVKTEKVIITILLLYVFYACTFGVYDMLNIKRCVWDGTFTRKHGRSIIADKYPVCNKCMETLGTQAEEMIVRHKEGKEWNPN